MGNDRKSVGSGPITASNATTTSATVRASGPRVDRCAHDGAAEPPLGTRPSDGLNPEMPQHDDGMRIEPPPSEPVHNGTMPEASAAAEPPDEPPGERSVDQGLRVAPNNG